MKTYEKYLIEEEQMSRNEISKWYKNLKANKTYEEAVAELKAIRPRMPVQYWKQLWNDAISQPSQFKKA
jgi:hypothetical protein